MAITGASISISKPKMGVVDEIFHVTAIAGITFGLVVLIFNLFAPVSVFLLAWALFAFAVGNLWQIQYRLDRLERLFGWN